MAKETRMNFRTSEEIKEAFRKRLGSMGIDMGLFLEGFMYRTIEMTDEEIVEAVRLGGSARDTFDVMAPRRRIDEKAGKLREVLKTMKRYEETAKTVGNFPGLNKKAAELIAELENDIEAALTLINTQLSEVTKPEKG